MKIHVKVITRSSEDKVVGFEGEVLKIKCRAVPAKGEANKVVVALLSKHYKVPKSQIKIVQGENSSRKIIDIKELE